MTSDDIVRGSVQPVGSATDGDTNIDGKGRPTAVNPWRAPGAQTAAPTAATPDAATGMHDAGQLPPTNKVQVAPRRATSYEEYQRLLQEEQQMLGQTRTDSRGRTYTGRDAVEDKNGRLRTGANALLDGLSMAGPQGDGRYGWGELAGDLARMAGMFVGGTINKRYDEKRDFDKKLRENRQQQEVAGNAAIFDQKQAKADADLKATEQKTLDDRVKPLLDAYMKDDVISPEEAKTLQTLTQLPYSAEDWAKRYRTERGGITYVGKESDDKLKPDTSIKVEQGKTEKKYTISGPDGKPMDFILPQETAAPLMVRIQEAEAQRQLAIAMKNSDIGYKNDQGDYVVATDDEKKAQAKKAASATIEANDSLITALEGQNTRKQAEMAGLDPDKQQGQISSISSMIAENERKIASLRSDNIKAAADRDAPATTIKKPHQKPIKVNSRGGRGYGDADIESVIHK